MTSLERKVQFGGYMRQSWRDIRHRIGRLVREDYKLEELEMDTTNEEKVVPEHGEQGKQGESTGAGEGNRSETGAIGEGSTTESHEETPGGSVENEG